MSNTDIGTMEHHPPLINLKVSTFKVQRNIKGLQAIIITKMCSEQNKVLHVFGSRRLSAPGDKLGHFATFE